MFKSGIIAFLILCLLAAFFVIMPSRQSYLSLALGASTALVILIHFVVSSTSRKKQVGPAAFWIPVASLSSLFVLMPVVFAAALHFWGAFSIFTWILLISLTLTVYCNFLTVPLAVYQKYREIKHSELVGYYPSLSLLIPAFNEEKVLARTIETALEATYPDKEIIVIDDGSSDRTHQIAQSYSERGVKVVHRPNGGKAVALNHGLLFARGEIIVIVDADSQICKNTLIELVKPFRDPEVAAVAGNIKVLNRGNLLTKCQAMEYIASINIARRALDIFGSVAVVPGALGAYRREAMESSGQYDSDTLVEDFDITIKALKAGRVVQASSSAISYTEAPQTVRDFVRQRLRWYRGNFQAMWKHHDAAFNSRYGFLQRLAFPYMAISMTFLPFAGLVTIASAVLIALNGGGLLLVPTFLFFCFLQLLLCILAVRLDDEDWKLVLFSPLLIFGYKQLCDFILIRSFFDVIVRRKLKWTSVRRVGAEVSRGALSR
jgi:cellulose synthase/poly-beta-1,6-N-acetylglucosamine synthase-like glycosyltransferase